jgi:hypothetical protein
MEPLTQRDLDHIALLHEKLAMFEQTQQFDNSTYAGICFTERYAHQAAILVSKIPILLAEIERLKAEASA